MSAEKSAQRWYRVADKKDGSACLVEASNRAQAFRRAGEFYCTAAPASADEAIRMMREGADVIGAPTGPEQLDLEDEIAASVVPGAPAASGKEESRSDATGPAASPSDSLIEAGKLIRETTRKLRRPSEPRKASEVFGQGFGPRSAADDVD